MGKSPFQFYEEVLIKSKKEELKEIDGETGVIFGMAQENEKWNYGVMIYSSELVWAISPEDIESTGVVKKREDFYDGSSIRVDAKGNPLEYKKGNSG